MKALAVHFIRMNSPTYRVTALVGLILAFSILPVSVRSAPFPTPPTGGIDEKLFNGMRWRQIGPFRGGRALAIEGVAGGAGTYYFGAGAGGVGRTPDGRAHWPPLFAKALISSVGARARAPPGRRGA